MHDGLGEGDAVAADGFHFVEIVHLHALRL